MNRLHTRLFLTTYLFQYLKKNSPKQLDTSARLRSVIFHAIFLAELLLIIGHRLFVSESLHVPSAREANNN